MKTLEEHNAERSDMYPTYNNRYGQPIKNGIECPKCGEELFDSSPAITYTSIPPKKAIKCDNCNYTGYRIA